MEQLPEITGLPRGARFVRADLHIHSVAGSHDVKDASATPEAIVSTAAKEGLKIIAIADHNEIDGVAPALTAALLHESSLARTMPTDRILTCRCDTTLVGRGRSSD